MSGSSLSSSTSLVAELVLGPVCTLASELQLRRSRQAIYPSVPRLTTLASCERPSCSSHTRSLAQATPAG